MAGDTIIPTSSAQATAVSAQAPVMTPDQVYALVEQLMPKIAAFRRVSVFESGTLNPFSPTNPAPGLSGSVPLSNVGLGVRLTTEHTITFQITNSAAATASVALSPAFPWNLIASTTVGINGPPATFDAPGYESLLVALRSRKRAFANGALGGQTVGLEDELIRYSAVGANITLNAAQTALAVSTANVVAYLGGVSSVTIAASAAAGAASQFTVTFYTYEKLAHSLDAMVGALPLQDNSIDAIVTRTLVSTAWTTATGARNVVPIAAQPAALFPSITAYTAKTQYEYWTIPKAQPQLYADIIRSSYRVLTQRNRTFASTGQAALDVLMPKMEYLTAMHIVGWDSANSYLIPLAAYGAFRIQYGGGSATPVAWPAGLYLARQGWDYGHPLNDLPGYLLWDGAATADDVNGSDDAGWMDNVHAANPDFQIDINSGILVPGTYNACRESIVTGATA